MEEQTTQATAQMTMAQPKQSGATNQAASTQAGAAAGGSAESAEQAGAQHEAQGRKPMLYRHPSDKVIGGVCGGLAELVGWDPALVRILWVAATVATGGGGILAYLAFWALLPVGTVRDGQLEPAAVELNERSLGRTGMALIALGVIWFLANIGVLGWLWSSFWSVMGVVFWPALLVGAGYLLLRYLGRGEWNWRTTRDQVRDRVQSGVGERMPTGASMRQGMRSMRDRFPLKRSRTDRIFMGVCGGIGQRIGVDANLVRLVWAALSVGSIGVGVLIYVVVGLLLPQEQVTEVTTYDEDDVQVIDVSTSRV